MLSLDTLQWKRASSHLEGRTSWMFLRCGRCSWLTMGTSGTRSMASGKASPYASCYGPLGIPLPSMPGPKTLDGVGDRKLGFLSSADMELGVLLESPEGSQSSSRAGACTCPFLPSGSSSVTFPVAWIKGSVAFPRVFAKRLSHLAFPQGCPTCQRGGSRPLA